MLKVVPDMWICLLHAPDTYLYCGICIGSWVEFKAIQVSGVRGVFAAAGLGTAVVA